MARKTVTPTEFQTWVGAYMTRQAFYPHELSDELKAELEKGYQGEATTELDSLLE